MPHTCECSVSLHRPLQRPVLLYAEWPFVLSAPEVLFLVLHFAVPDYRHLACYVCACPRSRPTSDPCQLIHPTQHTPIARSKQQSTVQVRGDTHISSPCVVCVSAASIVALINIPLSVSLAVASQSTPASVPITAV